MGKWVIRRWALLASPRSAWGFVASLLVIRKRGDKDVVLFCIFSRAKYLSLVLLGVRWGARWRREIRGVTHIDARWGILFRKWARRVTFWVILSATSTAELKRRRWAHSKYLPHLTYTPSAKTQHESGALTRAQYMLKYLDAPNLLLSRILLYVITNIYYIKYFKICVKNECCQKKKNFFDSFFALKNINSVLLKLNKFYCFFLRNV